MKIKEYKTFKTIAKTAKENNLIISGDRKNLFDFSLLNDMEISDREKDYIKVHDLKHISGAFKESFYGTEFDNFSACIGRTLYHMQRVYSTDGKLLYRIFRLAKIEHNTQERTNTWSDYTVTTHSALDGYMEPMEDVEIA